LSLFVMPLIFGAAQAQQTNVTHKPEAVEEFNRAVAATAKGDKKKAEEAYRKAIKSDPAYAEAYNNLGILLEARGAKSEAEEAYKKATELDPKMVMAFLNLGTLQYEAKKLAEAEQSLTQGLSLVEANKPATTTGATTPAPSGETVKNTPAPTGKMSPEDQAAQFYYLLGMARSGLGKHAEAIKDLRESLKLRPANALAHHFLAMSLTGSGDDENAITEFREAVRLNPQLAEAFFNLGVLLARAGKNAEATEAWQTYLKLQPNSPQRAQLEEAMKQMAAEKKP
jgi:tetratricopeptide (TPR) repeat protein